MTDWGLWIHLGITAYLLCLFVWVQHAMVQLTRLRKRLDKISIDIEGLKYLLHINDERQSLMKRKVEKIK